jgi:hypothetical protein
MRIYIKKITKAKKGIGIDSSGRVAWLASMKHKVQIPVPPI